MEVENGLVIPSKSILKSQNNDDYVFVATPSSKGNYSVKKVNVALIEKQDGKALIEKNANIVDGTKIIVEGARGITEKDLVRIK
jgi:multidrug efflux pump subunit AcrA (membrane-fusion protein)